MVANCTIHYLYSNVKHTQGSRNYHKTVSSLPPLLQTLIEFNAFRNINSISFATIAMRLGWDSLGTEENGEGSY